MGTHLQLQINILLDITTKVPSFIFFCYIELITQATKNILKLFVLICFQQ